jgi:hypothetical protein
MRTGAGVWASRCSESVRKFYGCRLRAAPLEDVEFGTRAPPAHDAKQQACRTLHTHNSHTGQTYQLLTELKVDFKDGQRVRCLGNTCIAAATQRAHKRQRKHADPALIKELAQTVGLRGSHLAVDTAPRPLPPHAESARTLAERHRRRSAGGWHALASSLAPRSFAAMLPS